MSQKISSITLIFLVCFLSFAQEKPVPTTTTGSQPVPEAEALAKAEKTIKEIFKAEYAKKKAADQIDLSTQLHMQAGDTIDDLAAKYVLLREARDLAVKAGDASLAMKVVDDMVRTFAVTPTEIKLKTLESLEKSVTGTTSAKSVVDSAMVCVGECLPANAYDTAAKFLRIAQAAAIKTRSTSVSTAVANRTREVETLRIEYDKLKPFLDALKEKPDDPEANLYVGKFLCFQKGEWTAGLPALGNGSDASLKALAKKDLDAPTEAVARVELADQWWNAGDKLDKGMQTEIRLRACHWYKEALNDLTGLTKTRVEKRLLEMDKVIAARMGSAPPPTSWVVLFRSEDPRIWNTDVKKDRNHFAVKLSTAPERMKYLKLADAAKPKDNYAIIELTKEQLEQRFENNGYGWNGTNHFEWQANQLGIYDLEWKNLVKGDIMMQATGFLQGLRGWGFGARFQESNGQGWTWEGKTLPGPTVFEISVKAADLTADEVKHLLKKKKGK